MKTSSATKQTPRAHSHRCFAVRRPCCLPATRFFAFGYFDRTAADGAARFGLSVRSSRGHRFERALAAELTSPAAHLSRITCRMMPLSTYEHSLNRVGSHVTHIECGQAPCGRGYWHSMEPSMIMEDGKTSTGKLSGSITTLNGSAFKPAALLSSLLPKSGVEGVETLSYPVPGAQFIALV